MQLQHLSMFLLLLEQLGRQCFPLEATVRSSEGATVSFDGGVGEAWACGRTSKESSSSVVLEANCMSNVVSLLLEPFLLLAERKRLFSASSGDLKIPL